MPRRVVPEGEGKRVPVMSRTTREMRGRLEAAASQSGRSLGQEVEARLERSFERDHSDAIAAFAMSRLGGDHTASLVLRLAETIRRVEAARGEAWKDEGADLSAYDMTLAGIMRNEIRERKARRLKLSNVLSGSVTLEDELN